MIMIEMNDKQAPRKDDRPRYIQHEWEIEFLWDGKDINKIPRHLSITVEQFCLPWKTQITLADMKKVELKRKKRRLAL